MNDGTAVATTFSLDFELADVRLSARLSVPSEPAWASVLLLPGGGFSDGEGNDSFEVNFSPLAQWAEQLAAQGIASLRFDRRGLGASGGDLAAAATTLEDAIAIVEIARSMPELPAPWLCVGLAEGAIWATLVAQQSPHIRGLVLVAPPAHPVGDLMQYRQAILQADASLAEIQARYAAQAPLLTFEPIFKVACPLLLLHGADDAVIPPACSADLAIAIERRQAPRDSQRQLLPGLDHWLCRHPGEIDTEAVTLLVDWVRQKIKQE